MERENEASEEEFGGQTDGTEEEEESRTQAQSTAIYQRGGVLGLGCWKSARRVKINVNVRHPKNVRSPTDFCLTQASVFSCLRGR